MEHSLAGQGGSCGNLCVLFTTGDGCRKTEARALSLRSSPFLLYIAISPSSQFEFRSSQTHKIGHSSLKSTTAILLVWYRNVAEPEPTSLYRCLRDVGWKESTVGLLGAWIHADHPCRDLKTPAFSNVTPVHGV